MTQPSAIRQSNPIWRPWLTHRSLRSVMGDNSSSRTARSEVREGKGIQAATPSRPGTVLFHTVRWSVFFPKLQLPQKGEPRPVTDASVWSLWQKVSEFLREGRYRSRLAVYMDLYEITNGNCSTPTVLRVFSAFPRTFPWNPHIEFHLPVLQQTIMKAMKATLFAFFCKTREQKRAFVCQSGSWVLSFGPHIFPDIFHIHVKHS